MREKRENTTRPTRPEATGAQPGEDPGRPAQVVKARRLPLTEEEIEREHAVNRLLAGDSE